MSERLLVAPKEPTCRAINALFFYTCGHCSYHVVYCMTAWEWWSLNCTQLTFGWRYSHLREVTILLQPVTWAFMYVKCCRSNLSAFHDVYKRRIAPKLACRAAWTVRLLGLHPRAQILERLCRLPELPHRGFAPTFRPQTLCLAPTSDVLDLPLRVNVP